MSRTEAKGKSRKFWNCEHCGWTQTKGQPGAVGGSCPECYNKATKHWEQVSEGKIDWKTARKRLKAQGIELRGGDADEAPGAYKSLPEVMAAHMPHVKIVHTLRPIGVAMAGSGVKDAYKD